VLLKLFAQNAVSPLAGWYKYKNRPPFLINLKERTSPTFIFCWCTWVFIMLLLAA